VANGKNTNERSENSAQNCPLSGSAGGDVKADACRSRVVCDLGLLSAGKLRLVANVQPPDYGQLREAGLLGLGRGLYDSPFRSNARSIAKAQPLVVRSPSSHASPILELFRVRGSRLRCVLYQRHDDERLELGLVLESEWSQEPPPDLRPESEKQPITKARYNFLILKAYRETISGDYRQMCRSVDGFANH